MSEVRVDARLEAVQALPLHQIDAEAAETKARLEITEARPQYHAQPNIGVARRVAIAVFQRQAGHSRHGDAEKVLVGEIGRRHSQREHLERRDAVGVACHGQIDERSDGAVAKVSPEPLVFLPDVVVGRVRRKVDANPAKVFETDLYRAVASVERGIEGHPQTSDGRCVN